MYTSTKSYSSPSPTPRNSNFELLRIIAMLLIVASHFAVHGNFHFNPTSITLNRIWIQSLVVGNIGVNVFVLISGYFLCAAKNFSFNKILRLWASVVFYSILFLGLFEGFSKELVTIKQIAQSILPITYNAYWFISTYFVLYILHPFINFLISNLSKETYKKLLLLLTLIWCIVPTFLFSSFQSNALGWFIYLYLVAGYIRQYIHFTSSQKYLMGAFGIYILSCLVIIILDIAGTHFPIFASHALTFVDKQKIFTLFISLLLFLGFKNIKLQSNRFINLLASSTLGIYLIPENIFVRPFLWKTLFKNATYADSNWLILYSIGVVLLVFFSSSVVELLRITILEKIYKKPLQFLANSLEKFTTKILKLLENW